MTADEWIGKVKSLERTNKALGETNSELRCQVEEWKNGYSDLEESKKVLYEQIKMELDTEKENSKNWMQKLRN